MEHDLGERDARYIRNWATPCTSYRSRCSTSSGCASITWRSRKSWRGARIRRSCGGPRRDTPQGEQTAETRGEWYLRQFLGSANFPSGPVGRILTGSLGYQIEHHLFPDLPSNRLPAVSRQVRGLAAQYGLPCNCRYGTPPARYSGFPSPGGRLT
ncbi:fatty acid desaturase [Nocardia sp. NPDC056611]|uniref:fatty acid desaturase n=1 Tax=Nocardia sp. NPDC056611 TaxID=3345877 RepID=UPI00366C093D